MQPLSALLWFSELPTLINKETRDFELDDVYDENPSLAATELQEIISTIKHHPLVSVTVLHDPRLYFPSEDEAYERDITEEVLAALARLLHDSRRNN